MSSLNQAKKSPDPMPKESAIAKGESNENQSDKKSTCQTLANEGNVPGPVECSTTLVLKGFSGKHWADCDDDLDENDDGLSPVNRTNFSISSTSSNRDRPSSCVFVASLSSSVDEDALSVAVTDLFRTWGKLSSVKVLRDTCNRPYAFVQYHTDADARRAIKLGHNSTLHGRSIRCEHAKVNRTLFLSSKQMIAEGAVEEQMKIFGEIEQLAKSDGNGKVQNSGAVSKHWYCKFVYRDDAIRAFASLSESNWFKFDWAKNIETEHTESSCDEEEVKTAPSFDKCAIFVGQLSPKVEEADLWERFQSYGKLTQVSLIKREANNFAFIKFKDASSAASAVERENHSMLCGKTMHVQYRELSFNRFNNFHGSKSIDQSSSIELAPPPINLHRRNPKSDLSSGGNRKSFSKGKFTGNPSNNFNKGRDQYDRKNGSLKNGKQFRNQKSEGNIAGKFPNEKFPKLDEKKEDTQEARERVQPIAETSVQYLSSQNKKTPSYLNAQLPLGNEKVVLPIRQHNPTNNNEQGPRQADLGTDFVKASFDSKQYCSDFINLKADELRQYGQEYSTVRPPDSRQYLWGNHNEGSINKNPNIPYYYYYPPGDMTGVQPMTPKFHPASGSAPHPPPSSYYYPQYFLPYDASHPLFHCEP